MTATDPNRPLRRCNCHQVEISAPRDEKNEIMFRRCLVTLKKIPRSQTYLATHGSKEPYVAPPDQSQEQRKDLSE